MSELSGLLCEKKDKEVSFRPHRACPAAGKQTGPRHSLVTPELQMQERCHEQIKLKKEINSQLCDVIEYDPLKCLWSNPCSLWSCHLNVKETFRCH